MPVRSARGEMIDFELLAIKSQLAKTPVPQKVEERKAAIEEREGVKQVAPVLDAEVPDILKMSQEAAAASAKVKAPKQK